MNAFECPFSLYARKRPKALAIVGEEHAWSYEECNGLIEGIAGELKKIGVKAGNSVALIPIKDFSIPLLFFALFRIQAIACPINTYAPLSTLPENLDRLNASLLLHPDSLSPPSLKQHSFPFSSLLKKRKPAREAYLIKEDRATYLATSGTTAIPKIACHSLGNHYYSALGSNAYMKILPKDRYLLSLPLYHIAGVALLFRTFLAGAALALSEKVSGITHASMIPTQVYRALKTASLPSYRHILLGGAPISSALLKESRERGLSIHPTYGMTEMSSQITTQFNPAVNSMGHPPPYRTLKIDPTGEVLVKGRTLFQGYVQGDGSLKIPLDSEGFFSTGDLGSYSPKQGLKIHGRKDRQFISGGENIQPEEIEKHLSNFRAVKEAKVRPTPDQEFGFRPTAHLQVSSPIQEEVLRDYLGQFLPKYKIPITFSFELDQDP